MGIIGKAVLAGIAYDQYSQNQQHKRAAAQTPPIQSSPYQSPGLYASGVPNEPSTVKYDGPHLPAGWFACWSETHRAFYYVHIDPSNGHHLVTWENPSARSPPPQSSTLQVRKDTPPSYSGSATHHPAEKA